jgi:hypothetical protein
MKTGFVCLVALGVVAGVEACSGGDVATDGSGTDGGGNDAVADTQSLPDTAPQPDSGGVDAAADSGLDSAIVEASSDAPSEAMGDAGWSPPVVGGALALWLNGDVGTSTVNCTPNQCVGTWADQSGNHNDATAGTAQAQPVLKPNQYNGHAALRFDGSQTSLSIPDVASLRFTSGYTIIGVAANTAAVHVGALFSKTDPNYPFAGPTLWQNYDQSVQASTAHMGTQVDFTHYVVSTETALSDSVLRVYAATYDPVAGKLFIRVNNDGAASITVPTTGVTATGTAAYVGGRSFAGQVFSGDIAELVITSTPIADSQWPAVYAYFKQKYALP